MPSLALQTAAKCHPQPHSKGFAIGRKVSHSDQNAKDKINAKKISCSIFPHLQRKVRSMANSSDEVRFLEQQIQALSRGALHEALQMATVRLEKLKKSSESAASDPKVLPCTFRRLFFFEQRCPLICLPRAITHRPLGFCRIQRLAVQGTCRRLEPQ